MKHLFFSVLTLVVLVSTSCETEEQKKLKLEAIKARRYSDSLNYVGKEVDKYLECQIKLLKVGASKEKACMQCKEIWQEGFYFDSMGQANATSKSNK
jgi:hypothetical protein